MRFHEALKAFIQATAWEAQKGGVTLKTSLILSAADDSVPPLRFGVGEHDWRIVLVGGAEAEHADAVHRFTTALLGRQPWTVPVPREQVERAEPLPPMVAVPVQPLFARRSPRWQFVRDDWLRGHGSCEACGATTRLNVHHVKPHHLFPDLELDESNFLTLCESLSHNCHFVFGHCLDWRDWNEDAAGDAARFLAKVRNRHRGLAEGLSNG